MSKMFMLAAVLLCSTAWLLAQDPSSSSQGSKPESSSQSSKPESGQTGAASGQTTVEGCLQGASGSFTLTDSSGKTYQLQGDTAKLSKHAGHEVQITGSTSGSNATGTGASGASGGSMTLTVEKVKHVSESCKTMGK